MKNTPSGIDTVHRISNGAAKCLIIACPDCPDSPSRFVRLPASRIIEWTVAGNLAPPDKSKEEGQSSATIRKAVLEDWVTHIIVCGHSNCRMIESLFEPELLKTMPYVSAWLRHAEFARDAALAEAGMTLETVRVTPKLIRKATETNIVAQLKNLQTHRFVASRVETGELQIHGWLYEPENARVLAFSPASAAFHQIEGLGIEGMIL